MPIGFFLLALMRKVLLKEDFTFIARSMRLALMIGTDTHEICDLSYLNSLAINV